MVAIRQPAPEPTRVALGDAPPLALDDPRLLRIRRVFEDSMAANPEAWQAWLERWES